MSLCSSSHPVSDLRRWRAGKLARTRSNSKGTGPSSKKGKLRLRAGLLELYDHAKEAVPFLKLKMRPLKITSGQAKALLLKLNSGDEHLWKTAFEELEYFDPRLAIGLPEMMERVTESPGRERMVEVLTRRNLARTRERRSICGRSARVSISQRRRRVLVGRAKGRESQRQPVEHIQTEVDPGRARLCCSNISERPTRSRF